MGRLGQADDGSPDIVAVAIIISGRPGSGKTTLAHELAHVLAVPQASFGDVVRAAAAEQYGDQPSAADLEAVGTALIEAGWVRFCKMLLDRVPEDAGTFVVDGVRHIEAARTLHALTGRQPVWLFVEAIPSALADRLAKRDPFRMRRQDSRMERVAATLFTHADRVVRSPWDLSLVAADVRRMLQARLDIAANGIEQEA